MTTLNEILVAKNNEKHATDNGTKMHKLLQYVVVDGVEHGDCDLVQRIKNNPDVARFFKSTAKTEVPIAGTINGQFVSRRIDRLCIDDANKRIDVIDYKTDVNRDMFYGTYIGQIREYVALLRAVYPDYQIDAYILWTHDFLLEKISVK